MPGNFVPRKIPRMQGSRLKKPGVKLVKKADGEFGELWRILSILENLKNSGRPLKFSETSTSKEQLVKSPLAAETSLFLFFTSNLNKRHAKTKPSLISGSAKIASKEKC